MSGNGSYYLLLCKGVRKMVFIMSELYYEGELAGYRCRIYKSKIQKPRVTDISTEEYEYIRDTYGSIYKVSNCPKDILHIDNRGYLCTGTEGNLYSEAGLEIIEEEILSTIQKDLESIKQSRFLCNLLKKKYLEFNKLYFNNKLPRGMRILVNNRYKVVGGCFSYSVKEPYTNTISMSSAYMEKYPDDVDNTLLHEMIHAYMFELGHIREVHGRLFKREMYRINRYGYNIEIHTKGAFTATKYTYAIQCKRCGVIDKKARKMKYPLHEYYCKHCSGRFEIIHKGVFYEVYKCNCCNEIFFEDDEEAVGTEQFCPYCGEMLTTIE